MAVAGALALFPVATLAFSLVESPPLAIPDASPIYLVAVVGVAVVLGTPAAITAAFLSFVLYNWLFVAPRFTLIVQDPTEWLNLLLLLFVGIVIGRLAALQSERAEDAARRARESQALFRISRTLATAPRVADALPAIVDGLANETRMLRIWIGRLAGVREVVVADSGSGSYTSPQIHGLLTRTPGDLPARWVRAHVGRSIGYDVRAVHISDDPTEAALVRAAFERQIPGVHSSSSTHPTGPWPGRYSPTSTSSMRPGRPASSSRSRSWSSRNTSHAAGGSGSFTTNRRRGSERRCSGGRTPSSSTSRTGAKSTTPRVRRPVGRPTEKSPPSPANDATGGRKLDSGPADRTRGAANGRRD